MNGIAELLIITAIFIMTTIVFGFLFGIINKQNAKLIQRSFGWTGLCFFGWIGVPVHELSHLLVAVLFGHSIKSVSLFRPRKGKVDGVLGFVKHTYQPKLYQKMGNFFIGAAPMIVGAVVLRGMLFIESGGKKMSALSLNGWQGIVTYAKETMQQVGAMFTTKHSNEIVFVCVLFCMIGIAVNMNMSKADVKNSLHGIVSLFAMTILVPVLIHVVTRITYEKMVLVYMGAWIQYVSILLYALVICSLILGVMYVVHSLINR